jgi:DegV family protein with EDD domain
MTKIAVITDSDSSLPITMADSHGIQQVPITIHFDNDVYTTGIDIDDQRVFEIVDRLKKIPKTAAPSPGAFATAYRSAFELGADEIICISVSSQISSTYNSALSACEEFPDRRIVVVDSLNLSMGQGFMALQAAEYASSGHTLDEIVIHLDSMRKRLHLFAVLPTLKYLALSGRVGKFVAGMADTLNIKPILTIKEGKLLLLERIRTRVKAVERMLELAIEAVDGKKVELLAVIHVNNLEGAAELESLLRERIGFLAEIPVVAFTPGLSVHAGAGMVGLVLLAAE